MSLRYQGGILSSFYNGLKVPDPPTIGTATAGSSVCASVAFTGPSCVGGSVVSSYTAVSNCGAYSNTSATSPVTVSGLTAGQSYTFRVFATNIYGASAFSSVSNSITAAQAGQQAYTSAGTYSWVAPSGVTSVSVVAVGGGGGASDDYGGAAGGGGLGYKNNYSVTPGNSYTVAVGAGGISGKSSGQSGNPGSASYFVSTCIVRGGGGGAGLKPSTGGAGGTYTGDGGGCGGVGGNSAGGGGGAGGYSGNGGRGQSVTTPAAASGSGGGGGGGAGYGGGGGGVGILGQGSNGAAGSGACSGNGGGGGSGGANGLSGSGASGCNGRGGAYGGGAGSGSRVVGDGGVGAVRIIWPGTSRSFPSTNTGNL